jgi:hypothetical protein
MTTKEYDDLKFALSIISGRCQDMSEVRKRVKPPDSPEAFRKAQEWAEDLVFDLIYRSLHHPEE